MTLEQLSVEALRVTGNALGFVVKSLAHPERKFKVCFKFASGKFGITRLDTGVDYIVEGGSDRYDFAIAMARIRELKTEIGELTEQQTVIATRLGALTGELEGMGLGGGTNVG